VLSSKWLNPYACPLGVSQASLLEHLSPQDFDMTQLLLRNQQRKFKMAEGCFIPISQQHTSNSKALWDFGSYGNSNRDGLLFEKEVLAAQESLSWYDRSWRNIRDNIPRLLILVIGLGLLGVILPYFLPYFSSVIKRLQMEDELPRKREEMMGYNPNMRRSQEMQRHNAHNAFNEEMQRYKEKHCNGVSDYTCFLQRYKKMHCDGFDWVLDDICIWVVNALNKEEGS